MHRSIDPPQRNAASLLGRERARRVLYPIAMTKTISLVVCLLCSAALAQPKPGQFTGVRQCTGTVGTVNVDATSKKTIGVATCKTELQKKLAAEGACEGKPKGTRIEYAYKFGKDDEPNQATGTAKLSCP